MHSLCSIAEEHDCLLYLDEAHAVGTLGPHGKGIAADFKEIEKYKDRILTMGTLTKTLSQLGGYVALFNTELDRFLRACSPQYIFSAPVPPWIAEATIRIIKLISGDFGEERRQRLKSISKYLRTKLLENGFDILNSESQIIPALIGEQSRAEKIRNLLEEQGFLVSLFKYPAVPKDGSLIRFSLCADITEEEIDQVMKTMLSAREKFLAH
jgi:7-keto-8-aminopelargonate synthetase-like enzyme